MGDCGLEGGGGEVRRIGISSFAITVKSERGPLSLFIYSCDYLANYAYICCITYTRACVTPPLRPFSWIGKAGAGVFSVDGRIGGEWKIFIILIMNIQ